MTADRLAFFILVCSLVTGCEKTQRSPGQRKPEPIEIVEMVYDGALSSSWSEKGWAPRVPTTNTKKGPASFDFSEKGTWIAAQEELSGSFGGLVFRFRAPVKYGDFFEVRVESTQGNTFPRVKIGPEHRLDLPKNWSEVLVPMMKLNPDGLAFDRLVIRAYKSVGNDPVELDKIGFIAAANPRSVAQAKNAKQVKMVIDCIPKSQPISPMIYGIAHQSGGAASYQWQMNPSARRWGGNPSTRYNWKLGNAWNAGSDWYFRNVNYSGSPDYSYNVFLEENAVRRVKTALTIPIMGWVAKDTLSYSYSVRTHGHQRSTDPQEPDAGDGFTPSGKPIMCPSANITSVYQSSASVLEWIKEIRQNDKKRNARGVHMYILDNEPFLWNSTHRDVHPHPTSYDELLEKTISYGTAIRKADPKAVIAGPALWGWPALFYSAKDSAIGLEARPDRRAHNDIPFLPWYLQRLREHEQKTGVKILDVVDVHFYPQGEGLKMGTGGNTDPQTNARRIRATRSLWDSTYVDESWIKESIRLIPRLRQWINQFYPGLKISVGEYNFGAENHISGALALSEALGQFAKNGLESAFYWIIPAKDSFAYWSFRAWRNFDGHGGRFLDSLVDTQAPPHTSLFASQGTGKDTNHVVAIVMNFDPIQSANASIDVATCGAVAKRRTFSLTQHKKELVKLEDKQNEGGYIHEILPPYSITVLDIELADKLSFPRKTK